MNDKNKIWLGWSAFLFVIFHFVMILVYSIPSGILPNKLGAFSGYYVSPVFAQQWTMFAPCPYKDYSMKIKYTFENGDTSDWIRPVATALDWHSKLRFTHHGELALAESNLMYWIESDIIKYDLLLGQELSLEETSEFKRGYSYKIVRRYAYGNAFYIFDKKPVSALVECTIRNVINDSTGSLILPKIEWDKK